MPTTTTTQRINLINSYTNVNVCSGSATPSSTSFVDTATIVTVPTTTYRVKPSDLLANMTARTLSVTVNKYAHHRSITKHSNTCSGIPKTLLLETRSTATGNMLTAPTTSPNAALKLRMLLEDANLNVGGYIGEYKETAALFTSAASSLRKAWNIAHGRLPRSRTFTPHDVSALYVHNQFAVQPLVSDMSAALQNLNSLAAKTITKKFVATDTDEAEASDRIGGIRTSKRVTSQRIILYADMSPNHSYLDFGNPIEWVWEAIPFSFVVDWFIPIGNTLGSINATKGFSNFRGCITIKETVEQSWERIISNSATVTYFTDRPHTSVKNSFTRSPFTGSVPVPSIPRFKNPLSLSHVLTSVALLHLLLGRKSSS